MTETRTLGDEAPSTNGAPGDRNRLDFQSIGDLIDEVTTGPAPSFLVRPIIALGDYGMFSAEDKAGKTWAMADLAVSVASETRWLDAFEIEAPGPVLIFVGEGGKRKLIRRLEAICESRGIDLATLPIRVCMRVPHFTSELAMLDVEAEVLAHPPRLIIVDPLYLAAHGARGSDIFEMGTHLERIQHLAQDVDASLLITHHWNKRGEGKGAQRMSGVGPGAWGRVLISAAVVSSHTDADTMASTVTLDLDVQGDEIAEHTVRILRRVWTDNPDDLGSPMHYAVCRVEAPETTPGDPTLAGLRPSAARVLEALDDISDPDGLTVRAIGDRLGLKARTVQLALHDLREAGLATADGGRHCSARAQPVGEGAEHAQ